MTFKSNRPLVFLVLISLTASVIMFFMFKGEKALPETDDLGHVKTLRFVYEVGNDSKAAINDATFSTYLPVETEGVQSLLEINSSHDYEVESGELGNRVLRVTFDVIPPYGVNKLTIVAKVKNQLSRRDAPSPNAGEYLGAEEYIETGDVKLKKLAQRLKGTSDAESAQQIYTWLIHNINEAGYTASDKGARYALQTLKGDCTEFMYLTIALARVLGIPSRGVGGYVYSESAVVKSADYHNWAELYFNNKWNIVDPQKKNFLGHTQDYISMRYLADGSVSLLGNSHRFSLATEQLKVKML